MLQTGQEVDLLLVELKITLTGERVNSKACLRLMSMWRLIFNDAGYIQSRVKAVAKAVEEGIEKL